LLTVSAQRVENVALNAPQCGECCFEMGLSVIIIPFFFLTLCSQFPLVLCEVLTGGAGLIAFHGLAKKASWD